MNTFSLSNLISIDLPALLTALFASLACALPGNYLLLRKQSLMGDAISHAVLPGIVVAFILSGSRSPLPVFAGAMAAALLCSVTVEVLRRAARLEGGAAMGVVFPLYFAAGVFLMEFASARNIDLDPDCLLHGQLESIFWFPPMKAAEFFTFSTLSLLPAELLTTVIVFTLVLIFTGLFYKELKLASFDPVLSSALGYRAAWINLALMTVVAAAVVASFKAVGSILVVAMIICPPATARLVSDRLNTQIIMSLVFSALAVISGYFCAVALPVWLGHEHSLSIAGMTAVTSGVLLALTVFFSPRYGLLMRFLRSLAFRQKVLAEDILGFLGRAGELQMPDVSVRDIKAALGGGALLQYCISRLRQQADIECHGDKCCLTASGRKNADNLLRSHRLWELYLVNTMGLRPDHVHTRAEKLEHFTSGDLQNKLLPDSGQVEKDPHGRPIPGA